MTETLQSGLEALLARYLEARSGHEDFGKHSDTWQLVEALADRLAHAEPVSRRPQLEVQWSVGRGSWAVIPWLALVDTRLGDSPRQAPSLMLLCRADMSGLYLALTVGVGQLFEEHGRTAGRRVLRQRVEALRQRWAELQDKGFRTDDELDLRAETGRRGRDLEEATVAWRFYEAGALPDDEALLEAVEAALDVLDAHAAANRRVNLAEDIQDPGPILQAAAKARRLGRPAFLERMGFHASQGLHLVIDGEGLDARAVVAEAYGRLYPEAGPLTSGQLEDTDDEALAAWLEGLGLEVIVGGDDRDWWRARIGRLERAHHQGAQPLAEALLTLILLGRARRQQAFRVPFGALAGEMGRALERFGDAEQSVEQAVVALRRHGFWWLDGPAAGQDAPELRAVRQSAGRVPPQRWRRLVEDEAFREELAGRLLRWFFPDRHLHAALRSQVGLDPALRPEALHGAWADFARALSRSGLTFGGRHEEVSRAFVASLATKRFVILTGLSGSGKTQIALKFGEWLGQEQHMVVPVRPDWTGSEALFGYEDALAPVSPDGRRGWSVPRPLAFLLQAARDPERPYLLILDEMNLAHVERYFADVLSGMESGFPTVPNLRREDDGHWRLAPAGPELLPVPRNLFLVGTVNVDETTYAFSPKVLDRANTLEFRVRTQDLALTWRKPTACPPGHLQLVASFLEIARDEDWHLEHLPPWIEELFTDRLRALHALLSRGGFEFGHRVFYEAVRFAAMLAACGDDDPLRALDHQVMQKVLPRLHGSRRHVGDTLLALVGFCHDLEVEPRPLEELEALMSLAPDTAALPQSFEKVVQMVRHLQTHQFTSFTG